jgi:glutamate synthase domain-containing protein 3
MIKEASVVKVNANGLHYRELNTRLRETVTNGVRTVELHNVHGQRYIGTDLDRPVEIEIFGTPGNDLGAFMNGPRITVRGNAQDGCGNTMNEGEIIVHGRAGDILSLSARGGKIFVREDVGYRAGIHMKEYQGKQPALVIGGTAQDFLGEYMAGGILILLGLNINDSGYHRARFIGTGMHGGVIYLRGNINDYQLGKEVGVAELDEDDYRIIRRFVGEFAGHFDYDTETLLDGKFRKLYPRWLRPYGRLYAY